jgi:hypothetical protein
MPDITAMFAMPLVKDDGFAYHSELKEVIASIIKGRECTSEDFYLSGIQNYFNSSAQTLFDLSPEYDILVELEQYCLKELNYCMSNVLYKENEDGGIITDSWVNLTSSNRAWQLWHSHANSYLSATYYVNYDKEKHQNLMFDGQPTADSRQHLLLNDISGLEDNSLGKYCKRFYTPDINEGDFIMWPSHILHGYGDGHSLRTYEPGRCSISMNYLPQKISSGTYSFKISR